jgi:hypothetical protein
MRNFLLVMALAGCGGNHNTSIDAATDTPIDMPPLALDCSAYCAEIQMTCTGPNVQYPNLDQCTKTCASFAVGTSTVADTAGNTLGCRIHYAVAASTMPATHCPHAGPAGDLITATAPGFCSGGDICTSFCTLGILACGSMDMPLPGNPKDSFDSPLYQYKNFDGCMRLCPSWDKTHGYSTMSTGDSLACRLSAAVTASISVDSAKVSCAYTADFPTGQCAGVASP